jgi:ABC-type Zn uptake system ZnuABC Zn-binding protein ZnuA
VTNHGDKRSCIWFSALALRVSLLRVCLLRVCLLWACLILPAAMLAGAADAQTVLTANQATYSLTSTLTEDTPITVVNVPEDGREMSLLADYIGRRMERLAPVFAGATAVVSLTNALPGDPLYRFAREANIRIVDIDAAIPWSVSMPGVALIDTPVSDVDWRGNTDAPASATAPYFWLSVSNAIRMADIIAHDLTAIFPEAESGIARNLDGLKWSLLNLRSDYQDRLIDAGDDTVFALTGDFVYLTNDMGLYVDGYFIKQDVRWTEDDLAMLTRHLEDRDIRVVIHKWLPSDEIRDAIASAGAELVVLQSGDPGIVVGDALAADGLQQILRSDLEALTSALGR